MARVWPASRFGLPSVPPDNSEIHLPPQDVQDKLLEIYFAYVHPVFPIIHKSRFWSEYAERRTSWVASSLPEGGDLTIGITQRYLFAYLFVIILDAASGAYTGGYTTPSSVYVRGRCPVQGRRGWTTKWEDVRSWLWLCGGCTEDHLSVTPDLPLHSTADAPLSDCSKLETVRCAIHDPLGVPRVWDWINGAGLDVDWCVLSSTLKPATLTGYQAWGFEWRMILDSIAIHPTGRFTIGSSSRMKRPRHDVRSGGPAAWQTGMAHCTWVRS